MAQPADDFDSEDDILGQVRRLLAETAPVAVQFLRTVMLDELQPNAEGSLGDCPISERVRCAEALLMAWTEV